MSKKETEEETDETEEKKRKGNIFGDPEATIE